MRTFLRRDVPSLQPAVPVARLERFWCMLAHGHDQLSSAAELARSLGIRDQVARRYLDLLTQTLVLLTQQPWHESVAKCQVESPEVCVADPGLVHALLDIRDMNDLLGPPSWGFRGKGSCSRRSRSISAYAARNATTGRRTRVPNSGSSGFRVGDRSSAGLVRTACRRANAAPSLRSGHVVRDAAPDGGAPAKL